jgi:hypothetical protein
VITKRRGVEVVDIRSLVAHVLSDDAAGCRGGGHYLALCGAQVIPASLTAAPESGLPVLPRHRQPDDDTVTRPTVPKPVVPDAPHGTLRGYSMGCRCLFCTSAKTATTAPVPVSDTAREGRTR